MNRLLLGRRYSSGRRRIAKKNPQATPNIEAALEMLADDAFDPRLRTHKLSGDLAGSWSCSAGYDLRIVFSIVEYKKAEAVLLETIGTHDEVY